MPGERRESIKQARETAGVLAVQLGILGLAALVFLVLAVLVYHERIAPDVLLFSSGVILGVLLKEFVERT